MEKEEIIKIIEDWFFNERRGLIYSPRLQQPRILDGEEYKENAETLEKIRKLQDLKTELPVESLRKTIEERQRAITEAVVEYIKKDLPYQIAERYLLGVER